MSREPINIAGVCAFPNPNGVRDMRFVDCNYNALFRLPNHSSIIMTKPDGTQMKQQCSYIDDYHIYIGQCGFHIMEFAEMAWRNGYTYLPEHPREQDCCDTYALYRWSFPRSVQVWIQPRGLRQQGYPFHQAELSRNSAFLGESRSPY